MVIQYKLLLNWGGHKSKFDCSSNNTIGLQWGFDIDRSQCVCSMKKHNVTSLCNLMCHIIPAVLCSFCFLSLSSITSFRDPWLFCLLWPGVLDKLLSRELWLPDKSPCKKFAGFSIPFTPSITTSIFKA